MLEVRRANTCFKELDNHKDLSVDNKNMEDPKQTRNESPKKHLEILTTNSHIKDKLIPS